MIDVAKAAIQRDGKFFLLKRIPNSWRWANARDFPGGICESGESPGEAIIREVYEETGLDIDPGNDCKQAKYYAKNHDEKSDTIFHYFTPLSFKGEPRLSNEHSDMGRFTIEEIHAMETTPGLKLFFDL